MKLSNQAETVADMNQKQSFPNLIIDKAYEGIVMTYLHKTKPNSRIESKKASKIESLIEKWTDENDRIHCRMQIQTSHSHMIEHVEKHIECLENPCNMCNKT